MLIDGKAIGEKILKELEGRASREKKRVCFISLSDDSASRSYVALKSQIAKRLGIRVEVVTEIVHDTEGAIALVKDAVSKRFDGIVVQLPLPKGIDAEEVQNSIPHELDIDVLSDRAKEEYVKGGSPRTPPVAGAVQIIFNECEISLEDKKVVVLGKGKLVGEPVMMLLGKLGVAYMSLDKLTSTEELLAQIKTADIVISGIGVPHFLKPDMVKEGVVLIDAGTSESEGKIRGDADPACQSRASFMTPVPGGIGPITVAVLYSNLFNS